MAACLCRQGAIRQRWGRVCSAALCGRLHDAGLDQRLLSALELMSSRTYVFHSVLMCPCMVVKHGKVSTAGRSHHRLQAPTCLAHKHTCTPACQMCSALKDLHTRLVQWPVMKLSRFQGGSRGGLMCSGVLFVLSTCPIQFADVVQIPAILALLQLVVPAPCCAGGGPSG